MRGFTLIELAVVMLIIGLVLGSLAVPFTTRIKSSQYEATQKQLNETREAVLGFAARMGRLPRPAVSFSDGTEMAACASEAACTGFIPWATLGVQKLDPYGKIIRYSVTPAFTSTFTLATVGTKTVMTRDPNPPYALVAMSTSVPAMIWSHGALNFGTSDSGTAQADGSATNTDENVNQVTSLAFICRNFVESTTATGGEFDDVCSWISPHILAGRMIAAGKLP